MSVTIGARRHSTVGRRVLGGLAAVLLALGLVGCSDQAEPASSPTASPQPTETASPPSTTTPTASPVDEQSRAALETYRQFWAAVTEARSVPDSTLPALSAYATGTALTTEQEFLVALEREGVAYEGAPLLAPEVSEVVEDPVPAVTITDCIDSSSWRPVRLDTGESAAAPGQEKRFYTVSRVERFDAQWFVVQVETDRSRTC